MARHEALMTSHNCHIPEELSLLTLQKRSSAIVIVLAALLPFSQLHTYAASPIAVAIAIAVIARFLATTSRKSFSFQEILVSPSWQCQEMKPAASPLL